MNRVFVRTSAVLAALGLAGAAGCGSGDADTAGDGAALAVVTSFYPLQYVTERIAGENADVTNLVPPGAEAHDFELSGQDIATVSEADLVVYLGEFQPAVDDAIASEASESAFDVTDAARLVDAEDLAGDEDAHEHDHDAGDDHESSDGNDNGNADDGADDRADDGAEDEADHEEHGDHEGHDHGDNGDNGDHGDHEDHDHGDQDPHFWLDPTRMADVADEIAARMADLDPDNADAFRANADDVRADLTELDEEFASTLETCESPDLVTSHSAFGYLADRYGFAQIGISGLSPEAEPNTAQLARVTEFVREHNVSTIYYETLVSPDVAEVVARETGAETAQLDPIEGITDESAGSDYLEIMRANLDTLAERQGCS